jgi:hypothetical protein
MHGRVEAEGGAIEVSSRNALALDGEMHAPGGTVLVDPVELRIVGQLSGSAEPAEITAAPSAPPPARSRCRPSGASASRRASPRAPAR